MAGRPKLNIDGEKISIPPTLLYSLLGDHTDVRKAVSSDFKKKGDLIYLLGETHQELGASELAFMLSEENGGGIGNDVPQIDTARNIALYHSITTAMNDCLIRSAHDCSDGGLAIAIAECCFGCEGATTITLDELEGVDDWAALFGESLGRIVVTISQSDKEEFEAIMNGRAHILIGKVGAGKTLEFKRNGRTICKASLKTLLNSWKNTLNMGGEV